MCMRIERANAKINVYLNVTARRENGYHDIVSIMQTVSLCDLVTVDFQPSIHTSIDLHASGNDAMPVDCRNLAWRAAEKYLQKIGKSGHVTIIIEKHIPMAAGLAGGSTDAAAVLRAMNALCGEPLSVDMLCELGATLGADVPFCIRGGSALVTGIGEILQPAPPMPMGYLVIARRGTGVSTPWAYGELDKRHGAFIESETVDSRPEQILDCWKAGDLMTSTRYFFNVFEEVVPMVQNDVNILKQTMKEGNAVCTMMSGSGPSVFGIFDSSVAAENTCLTLRRIGAEAFVCCPK